MPSLSRFPIVLQNHGLDLVGISNDRQIDYPATFDAVYDEEDILSPQGTHPLRSTELLNIFPWVNGISNRLAPWSAAVSAADPNQLERDLIRQTVLSVALRMAGEEYDQILQRDLTQDELDDDAALWKIFHKMDQELLGCGPPPASGTVLLAEGENQDDRMAKLKRYLAVTGRLAGSR